jgi:polysaccharide biosynthesis transport protein
MPPSASTTVTPAQAIRIILAHPWRLFLPAVLLAAVSLVYALVRDPSWEASQTVIVRNEAVNNHHGLGQFGHSDQMRAVQETMLEVAMSRRVLAAALAEVGPPPNRTAAGPWPTPEEVEDFQKQVRLTPPNGAQFGTTELFYLSVRDADAHRAAALAEAVCRHLESHFGQLRNARAASMLAEIKKNVEISSRELAQTTARLAELESEVGLDLAELRVLNDSTTGESALRRTVAEIEAELRQARSDRQNAQQLLEVLRTAQRDPAVLVAAPRGLLDLQPGLQRLKDGLVDSQIEAARLHGSMSAAHPRVIAAEAAHREVAARLHEELDVALRAVEVDLRMGQERIAMLGEQLDAARARLARLAELRADYAVLVAHSRNRTTLLERAEQELAEARAAEAAATAASLLAPVGTPEVGSRPVGPGNTLIVLGGLAGGFMLGIALVLLSVEFVPPPQPGQLTPVPPSNGRRTANRLARLYGTSVVST